MLTPKELALLANKHNHKTELDNFFENTFESMVRASVKAGHTKIILPAPNLEGLFYHDERQEELAKYLRNKGFKVEKRVETIGGVVQSPSWYLIFK